MRYLSVCSGIEAASVAWEKLGWKPLAFSEIEPFPSAVLKHHWPEVPNLGDMTKYEEWKLEESVDVLVGGTPCQAFSVAGVRKGLDDPRGGLTLTYVKMADYFNPKWVIWENVPGVFTSKDNAFGCFLGSLSGEECELKPSGKKWSNSGCVYGPKRSVAWRCFDAQYFGLAQRRKRVFGVGNQDLTTGRLLVSEAIPIHDQATRYSGKHGDKSDGKGNGLGIGKPGDPCPTLTKGDKHAVLYENHPNDSRVTGPLDVAPSCVSRYGTGGGNVPLVQEPVAVDCYNKTINETSQTLSSSASDINHTGGVINPADRMAVRRLTPTECERLQGFPDNHTLISWRGKLADQCPDGPRYKALGNSMAVPCMAWIGKKIKEVSVCG